MSELPTNLEIPQSWGWYPPRRHAGFLQAQLRGVLPESDLAAVEMVAYHQDRDCVLLRRRDDPARVMIVHANPARKKYATRWPVVFDGTFSEFTAREQKRHEIETRMIQEPNKVPGICPICFAAVADEGCGGIWTGSTKSKARNGPLHSATCKNCHALLISTPTYDESEAGVFIWEFSEWEDDAA
jgi:hypothetical protein